MLGMARIVVTAASESCLGDGIPIFFMCLSWFAHVDVWVNEAGEFDHVSGSRFQVREKLLSRIRFMVQKDADMMMGIECVSHIQSPLYNVVMRVV